MLARRVDGRQQRTERAYLFGEFRLLPDRQTLLCRGEPVRIGSRALGVLTLLVQRAGQMVGKAELQAHVWPDTFVDDSNLKVHVAALRRALREGGEDARGIVNSPGRGYCFTLPVTVEGRARPALRKARAFGLPARIIGREDEIAALAQAVLWRPLVTVVGAGGVGKTTVALAAAGQLAGRYAPPPCFVDLAAIDEPQLVAPAIAAALNQRIDLDDLLGGIADHLRAAPRLLVLDNCEHLSAAVAAAAGYLAERLGRAAILATSREPLRTRDEHVFRLTPLSCPEPAPGITAAEAMRHPAVALFVERAGLVLGDADAATVAIICRRLDGIPLAIELAAARLGGLSPAELLGRLQDRFELLRRPDPAVPPRQRTLLATLDWSYQLLSRDEARILRFAAVFARDFALDDLVAVLGPEGPDPADVVAGIEGLVAKSFGLAELSRGVRRYRLFESSRGYGLTRLDAEGERQGAHAAHAGHILAVLEQAEEEWRWRVTEDWIALYGPRLDDLRRAIVWAFWTGGDAGVGVRLTAAGIPLWEALGAMTECGARVREALAVAERLEACPPGLKARLRCRHAWTLTWSEPGPPATSAPWLEGLALAREAGEAEYEIRALWGLAIYESFTGQCPAAIGHLAEFAAAAQRAGDVSALPDGQRLLALAKAYVGELAEGDAMLERLALEVGRIEKRARVTRFVIDRYCIIRSSLAFTRWLRGRTGPALEAAREAVEAAQAVSHVSHSNALVFAGVPLALWTGDLDMAEAGIAALRRNLAIRDNAVWRRVTPFFEAALAQGRGAPGAADAMAIGLDDLLATGFVTRAPMYLAMLAEALVDEGRFAEAGTRIEDAGRRLAAYGERWCGPEILRIEGRILVSQGETAAARTRLEAAIAQAGALGTVAFQQRAEQDLAALYHD